MSGDLLDKMMPNSRQGVYAPYIGWIGVVALLCAATTFDTICLTSMMFLTEAVVLACNEISLRSPANDSIEATSTKQEPLFFFNSPITAATRFGLSTIWLQHLFRWILAYKIAHVKQDWLSLTVIGIILLSFAIQMYMSIYNTRVLLFGAKSRSFALRSALISYGILACACQWRHFQRNMGYRMYANDHRMFWVGIVQIFHCILAQYHGGRFVVDHQPLLPREVSLILILTGWWGLWVCSGHKHLVGGDITDVFHME